MKKVLLVAVAILLLPGALFAYQKPGNPSGFVNDYAQLLTAEQKQQLEIKLSNFEKQTGDEIAVATIDSLDGDTIENFAVKLFEDWQIGKKGQDNGLLLLIAKDDHKMRIEVGYGLEPYVTDIEASHLIQNVLTPAFRNEDYFGGINQATDLLIQKLGGENSSAFEASASPKVDFNQAGVWIFFGLIGLSFLSRLFAQSRSWWLGGVIGAVGGVVVTFFFGFFILGLLSFVVLIPLGLLIDFIFSRMGPGGGPGGLPGLGSFGSGHWSGGSSSSGGFGGFGGGSSGGGGASGGW